MTTCVRCDGKGMIIWVHSEKKPRPAYWFNKGPNGEEPSDCDCYTIDSFDTECEESGKLISKLRYNI
jgi:hypothetical protein